MVFVVDRPLGGEGGDEPALKVVSVGRFTLVGRGGWIAIEVLNNRGLVAIHIVGVEHDLVRMFHAGSQLPAVEGCHVGEEVLSGQSAKRRAESVVVDVVGHAAFKVDGVRQPAAHAGGIGIDRGFRLSIRQGASE